MNNSTTKPLYRTLTINFVDNAQAKYDLAGEWTTEILIRQFEIRPYIIFDTAQGRFVIIPVAQIKEAVLSND